MQLLLEAATKHEYVLTKPEPAVLFKAFGDSSLDFELQFWVMQENNGIKIKSEVALAVMQLLDDAGVEIPFPQRDLHVRSVDPIAAGLLPSNESQKSASTAENEFAPFPRETGGTRRTTGD
jgi:small-conductance mechanosensitive channel